MLSKINTLYVISHIVNLKKTYAQRFLIKQLKKNKFKIKQIAKILDVSVRTVAYIDAEKTPDFDER